MRIVHLTDLHFHLATGLRQLLGKRLLGAINLELRGRARQFGGASRDALVADVLDLRPDLVVITGDLTALATAAEFAASRDALDPLLTSFPVAMVAGNHDRYTRGSARDRRMERTFGEWMTGGIWDPAGGRWRPGGEGPEPSPARFLVEGVDLLLLDTARPSLVSRGRLDQAQLPGLDAWLAAPAEGRARLLGLHYPLLGQDGGPYRHPTHGLVGVDDLIERIRRWPVDAVLHGHVHRWSAGSLTGEAGGSIPVLNGGSSGLAPGGEVDPGYLVLEFDDAGTLRIIRRRWDGDRYRDDPVDLTPGRPTPDA